MEEHFDTCMVGSKDLRGGGHDLATVQVGMVCTAKLTETSPGLTLPKPQLKPSDEADRESDSDRDCDLSPCLDPDP
jgi:hypothetical protein